MATPRKEKAGETPGYCKTEELAKLFDLSGQWINQLTRDGVIKRHSTPAGKRFDVEESTRNYVSYLREKASGRDEKRKTEDRELAKIEAEVRLKEAKADIAELEAQELQGKMHRSEDVAALTGDLLFSIRHILIAMPRRLAVEVVGVEDTAEVAKIIRREVNMAMKELANYQYDPQRYEERVRERVHWDTDEESDEDDEQ